jgi:plastocyanin
VALARAIHARRFVPRVIRGGGGRRSACHDHPEEHSMTCRHPIGVAALALAAGALGVATTGSAGAVTTKTVTLKNIRYSPAAVTVAKGSKVRFVWRDGSIRHDVRFKSGGFKPSPLKSSGAYTLTFKKGGTFRYFCSVHSEMKGRVTVK